MSPFFSVSNLRELLILAQNKNRTEALSSIEQLKQSFLEHVLPDDAKLEFYQDSLEKVRKLVNKLIFQMVKMEVEGNLGEEEDGKGFLRFDGVWVLMMFGF